MVSGSKNDSRIKKRGKQKLVFAKDKKQAVTAIVVAVLFVVFSIYNLAKFIQEQNPQPKSTATTTQANNQMENSMSAENPTGAEATGGEQTNQQNPNNPAATTSPQTPEQATGQPQEPTAINQQQTAPAAPQPQENPTSPLTGLIILAIIAGLAFAAFKYLSKNGGKDLFASPKKGGKKGKQKFIIAKDSKQLATALVVVVLFLANSVYLIIKTIQEQNPQYTTANQSSAPLESQMPQGPTSPEGTTNLNQPENQLHDQAQDANDIYSQTLNIQNDRKDLKKEEERFVKDTGSDVEILAKKAARTRGKMVSVLVADSGRSNPFLPAGENVPHLTSASFAYLPAPPETLPSNTDAGKVMSTTISGILYDKYSPSAIINIEGTDYLVKKGDVINNYKVLSISKTQVIVQLGKNVYQAGVGELLSKTSLNCTVANLNKKFGGSEVSINVRKKGY